ncbi:hypothetical protein MKEN_00061400 [Mycena kentingensis (nom. inval.)]|nr:hypothetical protein MKEN_00061400 [Mycena kentingensis (nom. inval.)]
MFHQYQPPVQASIPATAVPYTAYSPYTAAGQYPQQYVPQPAQYAPPPAAAYAPQIPGYPQSYYPAPATYHITPQARPSTPPQPDQPPPPPDLTSITPAVASQTIRRVLAAELRDAGFSGSEAQALDRLERDVVAFIQRLYERAHQYADLSNRSGAIATDMILACEEFKIDPEKLRPVRAKINRRKKKNTNPTVPTLLPARSRSPSPTRLPSDDEMIPNVPVTLRGLPHVIPKIPPKHTYLRTPASPPKRMAIPTLEKKLATASMVQSSLKNLMVATADAKGQEEGELLGHIVNSEMANHPRKRWKLSQASSRKTRTRMRP